MIKEKLEDSQHYISYRKISKRDDVACPKLVRISSAGNKNYRPVTIGKCKVCPSHLGIVDNCVACWTDISWLDEKNVIEINALESLKSASQTRRRMEMT